MYSEIKTMEIKKQILELRSGDKVNYMLGADVKENEHSKIRNIYTLDKPWNNSSNH